MLDGWIVCQMFSYYVFSWFMGFSESGLGGLRGRLGRTIRNPQTDGQRG